MTFEHLQAQATIALRILKHEIRTTGTITPMFRAYRKGGEHQDFKIPLGTERLMNDGRAKEILFDFFRRGTAAMGDVEAWIFGQDIWGGRPTEEGLKHYASGEWNRRVDSGFVELQRLGWAVVEQALTIVAQTEDDVLMLTHVYVTEPKLEWIGPPLETRIKQVDFKGRMKMWGATRADITGGWEDKDPDAPVGLDRLFKEDR